MSYIDALTAWDHTILLQLIHVVVLCAFLRGHLSPSPEVKEIRSTLLLWEGISVGRRSAE